MSLRHRPNLLSVIAASVLATAAPAIAFAQPDEPDTDEAAADEAAADEAAADEAAADEAAADEAAPPPPESEMGDEASTWGVGGEEVEGKYKPRGKTGKLAELEEEEEEERDIDEGPPDLAPPGFAYLDTAIGFGDILVVEHEQGATNVSPTASFLIGLGYRIGDEWLLYARFPISTGDSDGPLTPFRSGARNPDTFKQIATGAFELGVKPHFILNRDMRLPVGLAFAFPSAQGDMFADADNQADLGKKIVNLGAAASRGWEDRGLFASKRLTVTPSGGFFWKLPDVGPGHIRLEPETKVEIMIRTGGADPIPQDQLPTGEQAGEANDVAVNWVLNLDSWYDLFDGALQLGLLRLRLAVGGAEETKGSLNPSGAQFIYEPTVGSHIDFTDDESFGMDVRLGYMLPIGGELGGDGASNGSIGGLRMRAGFFF